MTGSEHNTQDELAAYALQSLSTGEFDAVGSHLQGCASCRAEFAAVCSDLALLGIAVQQQPLPEGARQRFMAKLGASLPLKAQPLVAEVVPITARTGRRGPGFWIPWATAAALAIVAISLGVQNRALNEELHDQLSLVTQLAAQASRAQQVLEVLTAPTAQRVTLTEGKLPPQPTARATYLPERGGMVLLATNLKPLPEGKTYELWVIPADGTAPVPAGLFQPDAVGSATLVLPSLPAGIAAKAFGITIEQASGASAPTLPIVLSGTTGS